MSARIHQHPHELREHRATPMQFAEAVWRGCQHFAVTTEEAQAAILRYTDAYEWAEAERVVRL